MWTIGNETGTHCVGGRARSRKRNEGPGPRATEIQLSAYNVRPEQQTVKGDACISLLHVCAYGFCVLSERRKNAIGGPVIGNKLTARNFMTYSVRRQWRLGRVRAATVAVVHNNNVLYFVNTRRVRRPFTARVREMMFHGPLEF